MGRGFNDSFLTGQHFFTPAVALICQGCQRLLVHRLAGLLCHL